MKNATQQQNQFPQVKYSERKDVFVITHNGVTIFVNANLFRWHFEIPYTKKNGEKVTKEQIRTSKMRGLETQMKNLEAKIGKK